MATNHGICSTREEQMPLDLIQGVETKRHVEDTERVIVILSKNNDNNTIIH